MKGCLLPNAIYIIKKVNKVCLFCCKLNDLNPGATCIPEKNSLICGKSILGVRGRGGVRGEGWGMRGEG